MLALASNRLVIVGGFYFVVETTTLKVCAMGHPFGGIFHVRGIKAGSFCDSKQKLNPGVTGVAGGSEPVSKRFENRSLVLFVESDYGQGIGFVCSQLYQGVVRFTVHG
jgi:hypothetical protein